MPRDVDGETVARSYLALAREHSRMALVEHRNKRPIKSAKHTQAARFLQAAAKQERENPGFTPSPAKLDLDGDTKLLGPGDEPPKEPA